VPYGTRAPKELATPSADPGTAPTFCFRRPGRNAPGARGSRLLDRRPPHYRCPAVPGLKTPARAILTVPGSSVLPSEISHLPSGTAYYMAAFDSAALRQPGPVARPASALAQDHAAGLPGARVRSRRHHRGTAHRLRCRPAVHLCQALLSLWVTRETIPTQPLNVYSSHHRLFDVGETGNLPALTPRRPRN